MLYTSLFGLFGSIFGVLYRLQIHVLFCLMRLCEADIFTILLLFFYYISMINEIHSIKILYPIS